MSALGDREALIHLRREGVAFGNSMWISSVAGTGVLGFELTLPT